LALLDLFDNAVDATIDHTKRQDGAGATSAYPADKAPLIKAYADPYEKTGLVLKNSCYGDIPSLSKVLQPFNSDKAQALIGENGVGGKISIMYRNEYTIFGDLPTGDASRSFFLSFSIHVFQ
jgi:hypothetical protein